VVEGPVVVINLVHPVSPCHDGEGTCVQPRRQHEALGEENRPEVNALAKAGAGSIGVNVCGPEVERHPGTVDQVEAYSLLVCDPDRVTCGAQD